MGQGFGNAMSSIIADLCIVVLFNSLLQGKKVHSVPYPSMGWYREQEELLCKGLNTGVAMEQKENEK